MSRDDHPSRLDLLGDLPGCHLAAGYPDPRGWSVATENGWEIGHLKDLVVDARTLEVRYLLVELWSDLLEEGGGQSEVLTAAERARLAITDHTVTVATDGPDELWLYIGRHYRLTPGPVEARPAPWLEAHDTPEGAAVNDEELPVTALRVERD
jgi:PRC-barrel domain